MTAVRKLRKCAKFVASLFSSRKSKKEPTPHEERSTEVASPCIAYEECRLVFDDREEESDGEVDYCSWEPDLGKGNDGDDLHRRDSTSSSTDESDTSEPEEFEHCVWKPSDQSDFFGAPVEMSLFVWELDSKLLEIRDNDDDDDDEKPEGKTESVCKLKQEWKRQQQHLMPNCFSRTLLLT